MNTKLTLDKQSQLQELKTDDHSGHPFWLKATANLFSYIFHPLFIPVYISVFLVKVQPYFFSGISPLEQKLLIPRFIVIYSMFPLISLLLLRGLNFIRSVKLKTQRERIAPYIICMIYYFGHWYFLKKENFLPPNFIIFTGAIFFACVVGFLANIFMKISMHAIAAGVMIAFVTIMAFTQSGDFGVYVSVSLLIAGLVCTSRFIVSDHTQGEVYWGLGAGIITQVLVYLFT